MRTFFSPSGTITFGSHKGKHARDLPATFVAWAMDNIDGFESQYLSAKKPKEVVRSRFPKGRTYVLDYNRKFIP